MGTVAEVQFLSFFSKKKLKRRRYQYIIARNSTAAAAVEMTSWRCRGRRNSAATAAAAVLPPHCSRQPANTATGEPGRWEPIEYSRRLKTAPLPQTAVHQRGSLLLQSLPPRVGPRWAGGWKRYCDKCYVWDAASTASGGRLLLVAGRARGRKSKSGPVMAGRHQGCHGP